MSRYTIPKRLHLAENEGAKFTVIVLDANSNEWLMTGKWDGQGSYRPPTPEQFRDIEETLEAALRFWRARAPKPDSKVISLSANIPNREREASRAERRALFRELGEIERDYPDGGPADVMADRRREICNRLDELRPARLK
jgi:hypothetical protein